MREHARLARARAGDDEQRPVDVEHGLALGRIEAREELLVRGDGHASMLAAPSGDALAMSVPDMASCLAQPRRLAVRRALDGSGSRSITTCPRTSSGVGRSRHARGHAAGPSTDDIGVTGRRRQFATRTARARRRVAQHIELRESGTVHQVELGRVGDGSGMPWIPVVAPVEERAARTDERPSVRQHASATEARDDVQGAHELHAFACDPLHDLCVRPTRDVGEVVDAGVEGSWSPSSPRREPSPARRGHAPRRRWRVARRARGSDSSRSARP